MKHQKNKTPPPAQADKPVAPQSTSPKGKKRNASKPKPINVKQQEKQGNSNAQQHKVPHVPHAASAPAVVHAAPSTPPRGIDGVRYAGPTFHNSPAATALPKPTFGRSPPRPQTQPPAPQPGLQGLPLYNNHPPPMHHDHFQHHVPPSPFRGDFTHFNSPQPSPMSPGFPRDPRAGYQQDVFVMDDDYNRTRSASGTPPVPHGPSHMDLHAKSRHLLSMIGRTPSHDNFGPANGSPSRGPANAHPTMNQYPGIPGNASPNGLAAQHVAPNVPQHMATSHDARMRDGNLESLSQGLRSLLKIQGQ